jgi:hypothetical protein
MSLVLLTGRRESLEAWEEFRGAFCAGAAVVRGCSVGWQGGGTRADVHWHRGIRIWGVFRDAPPGERARFWNCFGVSEPRPGAALDITVEVNPPHFGENRRVAGAFLRDEANRFYIGHSGRIGGGRPGIGQQAFRERSGHLPWGTINTATGPRELMVFGPFVEEKFPERLASFVRAVDCFKVDVQQGQ